MDGGQLAAGPAQHGEPFLLSCTAGSVQGVAPCWWGPVPGEAPPARPLPEAARRRGPSGSRHPRLFSPGSPPGAASRVWAL